MIKVRHVKRYLAGRESEDLWINPAFIIAVHPTSDEKHPSVKCTISCVGFSFAVEETAEEVCSFIPLPSAI